MLSLGLHISFVIAHMLTQVQGKMVKGPPPIQVKYIESKKPLDLKPEKLIDAPRPPVKKEKPKSDELLAKFDNRSHSNEAAPKKAYKRKKTVVPKSRRVAGKTGLSRTQTKKAAPKKKFRKSFLLKSGKKPLPESDIGTFKSITPKKTGKTKSSPMQRPDAGSTLALLDGFDPERFASLDTDSFEESDDEPVSLDTTEEKYASYFARIKHQIERVWVYPSDAAQRRVSGDLSLTFRISKDGNLMGARVVDPSGYEILDVAALKAVKEAAPFYPFPENIRRGKITILANFIYAPSTNQ